MTPVTCMAGKKLALFGLGGSGIATALALKAGGAEFVAFDDNAASLGKARAQGIATADLRDADWSTFAALVLAPGVPLTHPSPHWTVGLARKAGVEIIGDIELFCRERATIAPGSPFVAITGTNGKSTTTALVSHIMRAAGWDVQMGGNIGTAILSLEPPSPDRVHVIEMSSFQIDLTPSFGGARGASPSPEGRASRGGASNRGEDTPARQSPPRFALPRDSALPSGEGEASRGPTIGVLLNITPDHLDRHGTKENYAAIKERVVASAEAALLNVDDPRCVEIGSRLRESGRKAVYPVAPSGSREWGFCVVGGRVWEKGAYEPTDQARMWGDLRGVPALRGQHNAENAAFACAVGWLMWLEPAETDEALRTFPGLAHRMEEIARLGKTIFVNDSKATNADSTEKALLSFPGGIFWILGGKPKEGGIEPLRPFFTKIAKAYLIGEATEAFAVTLGDAIPYERCGTLDCAVAAAAQDASRSDAPEPVVLLSPACASYDQYRNFELRGDHFRELVRALPGVEMRA